jgi:Zn-finger protein
MITIGLLVLCFIPLFQKILTSIKAGGVELQFRDYSVHEQIFIFLDGIASRQAWTFFTPRKGEIALGLGFKVLIDELLKNKRKELLSQLKKWFESDNDNHKWFAAEVIGYGKIVELKTVCRNYFEKLDIDEYWEPWQLNCLWAYSTFLFYEPLTTKLKVTKNQANRLWMIIACKQMIREEKDANLKRSLQEAIDWFPKELIDSCEEIMDNGQALGIN